MLTKEEVRKLPKKELKEFINSHGRFSKIKVNKLTQDKATIPQDIPQGALYFEGIASDGSENMNGYIIRPDARKEASEEYMNDFGGKVYYQHNMDNVIGQTLSISVDKGQLKVSGYVFDEYAEGKISKGLVTDLSTGHYTLEVEYENRETKKVITEEEFNTMVDQVEEDARGRDEYWDAMQMLFDTWIMAVTKLIWVEYSFVTVGSNKQAEATIRNRYMNSVGCNSIEELKEKKKDAFLHKLSKNDNKQTNDAPKLDGSEGDANGSDDQTADTVFAEETNDATIDEKQGDTEAPIDETATDATDTDNNSIEEDKEETPETKDEDTKEESTEEITEPQEKAEDKEDEKAKKTEDDDECDEDEPEEGGCGKKKKNMAADIKDENSLLSVNAVETLQARISILEKENSEYAGLLEQTIQVCNLQKSRIEKLEGFVDKAKAITIKNGVAYETKDKQQNKMELQLTQAYDHLTRHI